MKKKQDVKKKPLDLDSALEEVAKKLRPSANAPGCGNTNLYNTMYTTQIPSGNQGLCACYCCSCYSYGTFYQNCF